MLIEFLFHAFVIVTVAAGITAIIHKFIGKDDV